MRAVFAPLPCPDSPLRWLDPRWKLASFALAVVGVALIRSPVPLAVALIAALAVALVARVPWHWLLGRLGLVLLVLLPFLLALPLLVDDPDAVDRAWWQPSSRGIALALGIGAKALALVTIVLVLLTSSPLIDTLKAAHCLRIPGLLIQLFVLTYRFLFLIAEELARVRIALRVRGYRNRATRHSYRTIAHVAGTLLVRSHERGERVGQAMRCRGFDGQFRSLTDFRTRLADVAFLLLTVAAAAGLVAWDFILRTAA